MPVTSAIFDIYEVNQSEFLALSLFFAIKSK